MYAPPNKRRKKRASPEDLYKSCRLGGDCPPDVRNKYEQNTLADRLLKWLGSIIYLGGLGIGTGKGTGGTGGYRPLQPSGAGAIPETIPLRPNIPIDSVPAEVIPGLVGPDAPSVVPVSEVIPEFGVAIEGGTSVGPSEEVTVIEEILNPSYDNTGISSHPTVITGEESDVAILNVSPDLPPRRIVVQVDVHQPPDLSVNATSSHADAAAVFVDPLSTGDTLQLEEIELDSYPGRSEFDIEEQGARTSTPINRVRSAVRGARNLYYRLTSQVRTFNPDFLGNVGRAVQFSFDNPAFDADVSLQFEQDLEALAAAPDPDFRDVRELHRLQLNATPQGTVRASRLGRRGFFSTRSGTIVGENVHFYYDISPIRPESATDILGSASTVTNLDVQSVPLEVLGSSSGLENVDITVNNLAETSFVDGPSTYDSEEALLDPWSENFDNSHLLLSYQTDNNETLILPTFPVSSPKVFVGDSSRGLFVHSPVFDDLSIPTINVNNSVIPLYKPTSTIFYSSDPTFYLDPYLQRKRKRRYSDAF